MVCLIGLPNRFLCLISFCYPFQFIVSLTISFESTRRGDIAMKSLRHIIIGTTMLLWGFIPAFGNSWLNPKTNFANRWTYIFFDRIIDDYAGLLRDYEKAHRHSDYRNLNDRWYYHYGRKLKSDDKDRYYQGYRNMPKANIYTQPNYTPKNYMHRKPIQIREHIPRNSFRYRSPFPRARIGQ